MVLIWMSKPEFTSSPPTPRQKNLASSRYVGLQRFYNFHKLVVGVVVLQIWMPNWGRLLYFLAVHNFLATLFCILGTAQLTNAFFSLPCLVTWASCSKCFSLRMLRNYWKSDNLSSVCLIFAPWHSRRLIIWLKSHDASTLDMIKQVLWKRIVFTGRRWCLRKFRSGPKQGERQI